MKTQGTCKTRTRSAVCARRSGHLQTPSSQNHSGGMSRVNLRRGKAHGSCRPEGRGDAGREMAASARPAGPPPLPTGLGFSALFCGLSPLIKAVLQGNQHRVSSSRRDRVPARPGPQAVPSVGVCRVRAPSLSPHAGPGRHGDDQPDRRWHPGTQAPGHRGPSFSFFISAGQTRSASCLAPRPLTARQAPSLPVGAQAPSGGRGWGLS